MYFTPIGIDSAISPPLKRDDIFVRLMGQRGLPAAVLVSSLAFSDARLCIVARSCHVRISKARSLLKTCVESAVTRAVFIYKRSVASPIGDRKVAAKRFDNDGSGLINFSKLWNHRRSS
jgi:hypothetical protein